MSESYRFARRVFAAALFATVLAACGSSDTGGGGSGEAPCGTLDALRCSGQTPQQCGADGRWLELAACVDQACVGGGCFGSCTPGTRQCTGQTPQLCSPVGDWTDDATCVNQACVDGACTGTCAPGARQCAGQTPQLCSADGTWTDEAACVNQTCVAGTCAGSCAPAETRCNGTTVERCDASGAWTSQTVCSNQACVDSACVGSCTPGAAYCNGNVPVTCDGSGNWVSGTACSFSCSGGSCSGECSPGTSQACTGGSCSGTQVCSGAGTWGACSVPANCQCTSGQSTACTNLGWACGYAACNAGTFQWDAGSCSSMLPFYPDADGDGRGSNSVGPLPSCTQPAGYVGNTNDCDDSRANRFYGNPEGCGDGVDNDCDGTCEEDCMTMVAQTDSWDDGHDQLLTDNYAEYSVRPIEVAFFVYNSYIPGVTEGFQLDRCLNDVGEHYVELSVNNCPSREARYGYPMLSSRAGAKVGAGEFCFADCGDGHGIHGGVMVGASCSTSLIACGGGVGTVGYGTYTGAYFAAPVVGGGGTCWGQ